MTYAKALHHLVRIKSGAIGIAPVIVAIMAIFTITAAGPLPNRATFITVPLSIQTSEGRVLQVTAEVADTEQQITRSLMYRGHLSANHGMLFKLKPLVVRNWTRGTPLTLDMIFLDETGVVTSVRPNAVAFPSGNGRSRQVVKYVLELDGGTAQRMNIKPGDRVLSPALG